MSDLKNEKIFSENLKYYMNKTGITRYRLCRALNLPYTTFAGWYNAQIYPKIDKIELLANFFDITKSDLIEDRNKMNRTNTSVTSIPILKSIKYDYNYMDRDNWVGTIELEKSLKNSKSFFAYKIKDDSMAPAFFEDDIVIMQKQNICENNDFALVVIKGQEAILRKIKKVSEGLILLPINPAYGPIMFTNKEINETPIIIAGVFQELRRTKIKF